MQHLYETAQNKHISVRSIVAGWTPDLPNLLNMKTAPRSKIKVNIAKI